MHVEPRQFPPSVAEQPHQAPPPRRLLGWRIVLALLLCSVCWLAFSPNPPPQADTGWDKLNHLLAFSVLAVCACLASAGARRRFVRVSLALLAYGVFIEAVQTQIPGRSGEWPDLLADGMGIAIGLLLVAMLDRLRKSRPWTFPSWLTF